MEDNARSKAVIFVQILLLSFCLLFLSARVSQGSIEYNSALGFVSYFALTIALIRLLKGTLTSRQTLAFILLALFLLKSYTIYLYFIESTLSLPMLFLHLAGIGAGFLWTRVESRWRLLPLVLGSAVVAFMFFQGWDSWFHRHHFGTFSGRIDAAVLPVELRAADGDGKLITSRDLTGKVVLLDFWHTRCGVCFDKFPMLEEVSNRYKEDSSVEIYAVNKPIDEDLPNQAFEMTRQRGYSFKVVVASDAEMPEQMGVEYYPTTFVLDNNQIIFKGDIARAIELLDELKSRSR